ncbi:MAG: DUF421 domain-containing protein [Spirosomataceae bacterium]
MIVAIRLFGKKELSQLSVIDLVFILLISNSVQNAMVGSDSSLVGGIVAAVALFLTNFLLKKVAGRSKQISSFLQGEPIILIYQGHLKQNALQDSGLTLEELEAAVREHGVEKIGEVDLAVFEIDGNISVLSDNFKHRTVRKRKAHKAINKNE